MSKVIRLNDKTQEELNKIKEIIIKKIEEQEIDPIMKKFYGDYARYDENLIIQICIEKTMEDINEITNNR